MGGLAIAVLLLALAFLYAAERRHLREQIQRQHAATVEKFARVCAESVSDANELALLSYIKTLLASAMPGEIAWAAMVDPDGTVRAHSDFIKGDFTARGRQLPPSAAGLAALSAPVRVGGRALGSAMIAFDRGGLEA